jgi:hypothetical protein
VGCGGRQEHRYSQRTQRLRAELGGANPTRLERLLVERIVACWLHLHHLEMIYAGKESMSLELGSYYQRSLTSAQKRYLTAIKTLAVVRTLAAPVLQVNIAKKQVNVAGACVAASGEAKSTQLDSDGLPLTRAENDSLDSPDSPRSGDRLEWLFR